MKPEESENGNEDLEINQVQQITQDEWEKYDSPRAVEVVTKDCSSSDQADASDVEDTRMFISNPEVYTQPLILNVQNFIPVSTIQSESTIPELAGRVIINEHLQDQGALDTNVKKPWPTQMFPNLVQAGKVDEQKIGTVYIDNSEYQQFRDESEISELTPDSSSLPKSQVIHPNQLYESGQVSPLVTRLTPMEGSSKETLIVRRGPGRPRKHFQGTDKPKRPVVRQFQDPNKPKRPVGRPRKHPKPDTKGSKFQFGRTLKVDLGYKLPIGFKKRGQPRAKSAKNTQMYEMAKCFISKRMAGQFDVTPLLNLPSDPKNINIKDDCWITDPKDKTRPMGGEPSNQLEVISPGRPFRMAQPSEMPKVIKRGRGRPRKDGTPVLGSTVWTTESGTSVVTSSGQFASSNAPTTPTEGLNEPGVVSYVSSAQNRTTSTDFKTPKSPEVGQFDDVTQLLNPPSDPDNIDIEDDSWITDNISEPLGGVPSNHLEITPPGRPLGVAQSSEMPKVIKRGRGRPRKDGTPVLGSTVWTTESGTSVVTSSGQFAFSNAPTTPTERLN